MILIGILSVLALEVMIRGLLNCIKPIIVVDATHMKGKYKGIIVVAVSVDAIRKYTRLLFGWATRKIMILGRGS